jgi:4-hydroxy-tetrahydrodipicolinate synthase
MQKTKKGFIPVMLTPFKDNGEIDYDSLTQLTETYLEAGAAGMFANCLSSEMFELTADERLSIIKHVIKVVKGAVPVVATGTFGGAIQSQADFVNTVNDLGTAAVIAITGLLADEADNNDVFDERVFKLLDLTGDVKLGFYECPVPYKRLILPAQLDRFVDTGRVIYHKDTSLDIEQIKLKIQAGASNPAFGLYDAYMVHAVESLRAGSAGLSCIQGNFFPELVVWLCNNYADENLTEEVQLVQQFFTDNMDVMHNVYPVVAKYWLQKRGLNISTFTRRKVGDFSATAQNNINTLLDDYNVLKSSISLVLN